LFAFALFLSRILKFRVDSSFANEKRLENYLIITDLLNRSKEMTIGKMSGFIIKEKNM
jgi:hypothetical protein